MPRASKPAPGAERDGRYVTPELFRFYEELERHNDRAWFERNKQRYHAVVRDPLLEFVEAVGPALGKISSHVVADPRPVGGSLFRIYRDTRFSKDKTPYKTHAGVHFRHARGKEGYAPGYYLHLEPGDVFVAGGAWHPDSPSLRRVREAIAAQPARWKGLISERGFRRHFRLGDGATLSRVPRGFDPEHPCAGDLRRKDFIAVAQLSEDEVQRRDFPRRFAELCSAASPFMAFLARALEVPW